MFAGWQIVSCIGVTYHMLVCSSLFPSSRERGRYPETGMLLTLKRGKYRGFGSPSYERSWKRKLITRKKWSESTMRRLLWFIHNSESVDCPISDSREGRQSYFHGSWPHSPPENGSPVQYRSRNLTNASSMARWV